MGAGEEQLLSPQPDLDADSDDLDDFHDLLGKDGVASGLQGNVELEPGKGKESFEQMVSCKPTLLMSWHAPCIMFDGVGYRQASKAIEERINLDPFQTFQPPPYYDGEYYHDGAWRR